MTIAELEAEIAQLRGQPLVLLCRTPEGKEREMSIRECVSSGSRYIHIICDGLDELLEENLRPAGTPLHGGKPGNAPALPFE